MDANIYKEKLSKLPPWVRDYLDSMKSADYNILICDKYGIKKIEDVRKYLDLVSQIFFRELMLVSLFSKIKELFGLADDQARQMAIDLAGIRFMVIEEWLDKDVHQYIRDLGGDPNNYEKYIEEHNQALTEEDAYFDKEMKSDEEQEEEELLADKENLKNIELEVKDIFSNQIVDLLSWNDEYLIGEVNAMVIHLLDVRDQVFKNELLNLFLENKRIITEKPIILDGKETLGTVGNWLKNFVSRQGGAMFDTVVLSDFVNNSENAKMLSSQEKEVLTKILLTYRNLKFFPESLEEDLAIIALPDEESSDQVVSSNVLPQPENISKMKEAAKQYEDGSLEKMALDSELKKHS